MKLIVFSNNEGTPMLVANRISIGELKKHLKTAEDNGMEDGETLDLRFEKAHEIQLVRLISGELEAWDNDITLEKIRNSGGQPAPTSGEDDPTNQE